MQHEVLSPTRLVCHFYDAYECNNCIRRGTAAGERWKMRRGERKKGGGGGIGTTRTGFVPKVGGGAGRCLVILCMICTRATPPSCALPFSVVPSLLLPSSSPPPRLFDSQRFFDDSLVARDDKIRFEMSFEFHARRRVKMMNESRGQF